MINLLKRKDIDDARWNSVIAASKHETIYPYTWYLDASADQWSGLIMNDYECIMPIPYRKKYMLKYFYQPFFNQQLGVYSTKEIDSEIARIFLNKLSSEFALGEYAFNTGNILGEEKGLEIIDCTNYLLDLSESYDEISARYSNNTKRNIRKVYDEKMELSKIVTVDDLIQLKMENNPAQRSESHYNWMRDLFSSLLDKKRAVIYGVKKDGELLAASLFALSEKRAIYLLSVSSETGKEKRAMFQIIDSFIQLNSGQGLLLDFEGSNIPSIARFFGGFGAKATIYQRVKKLSLLNGLNKLRKNG